MTDQKRINIDAIGNVVLRKSNRAKYLAIRIRPNEGVIVTIPKRVSYKEGEYFVTNKRDWILKHLTKIKKIEDEQILFDEETIFTTKEHKLNISKHDIEKTKVLIANSEIVVKYPSNQDVNSEIIQSEIKIGITNALRTEAKKHLPRRVEELSYLFNLPYNRLFLKNVKSRWGSCSVKNNINLNIHLMRLPEDLIDYVILHELVHTIHKNHGKYFWTKLDNVIPNSKSFDKQLKNYSPNYF